MPMAFYQMPSKIYPSILVFASLMYFHVYDLTDESRNIAGPYCQ
jgi:hypothetical protein